MNGRGHKGIRGKKALRMAGETGESDPLRVWFRLMRLETRMRTAVAEGLREIGLSVPQCDVLTTLTEQEGVSQQDLAKRLYVTKGNISGLIDRLVAAGLVERRAIAADKRQHAIFLTAAGRAAAEQAIACQRRFVARTIGRLPADQLSTLERLLVATRDLVRARGE
jgi:MarR family transcriptional regulator, organic hydroperoxide resistance regulator